MSEKPYGEIAQEAFAAGLDWDQIAQAVIKEYQKRCAEMVPDVSHKIKYDKPIWAGGTTVITEAKGDK